MIEFIFKLTPDDGAPRDISVRIHAPTRSPPEKTWPWTSILEVDGRSYAEPGSDPLDAIESACQHAARLLHGLYGDALDPRIEPRVTESPTAEPPEPAKDG